MAEISGGIPQSMIDAIATLQANMPTAYTSVPPGVTDVGSVGNVSQYAQGNHTHASKARKEIKTLSATGLYTWTFPTAFGVGVVPIVSGLAVCPSGTTSLVNVQGEGDPTNTQATFRITVYQQSVVALIGLTVLSTAGSVPANSKIHLLALEP